MITLQTQPTPTSCVQTCLAMILGVPALDVLAAYPQPMGVIELLVALSDCGVLFNAVSAGPLWFEPCYTLGVPSLNFPGGMHQIIVDISRRNENRDWVFDPNSGREDVKTYAPDGSNLRSWATPILFCPGGKLPAPR